MVTNLVMRTFLWAQGVRDSLIDSIKDQSGQDLIEYAVLVGGIAIALFAAFLLVPLDFTGFIQGINNCISFSGNCP